MSIITDIDWSKSHCGVYLCDYKRTLELMPEVAPVLYDLAAWDSDFWDDKLIDVKVHMLMPKQFPCIPDWHYDFRPRDEGGERIHDNYTPVGTGEQMWGWISGPPFTEFVASPDDINFPDSIQKSDPQEWHPFTQDDLHRGAAATEHCWRCFVRVIPAHLAHAAMDVNTGGVRRHAQVYLDAGDFNW